MLHSISTITQLCQLLQVDAEAGTDAWVSLAEKLHKEHGLFALEDELVPDVSALCGVGIRQRLIIRLLSQIEVQIAIISGDNGHEQFMRSLQSIASSLGRWLDHSRTLHLLDSDDDLLLPCIFKERRWQHINCRLQLAVNSLKRKDTHESQVIEQFLNEKLQLDYWELTIHKLNWYTEFCRFMEDFDDLRGKLLNTCWLLPVMINRNDLLSVYESVQLLRTEMEDLTRNARDINEDVIRILLNCPSFLSIHYDPKHPSLKAVLYKSLTSISAPHSPEPTWSSKQDSFRILTDLTVSQLGCLFRVLVESKVFISSNYTQLLHFLSQHFSSRKTSVISTDSLRSKFYNLDRSSLDSVSDLLFTLIRQLKKLY